jgi:hypothetical protein
MYRGKLEHLVQKLSWIQNKIFKSFAGKIAFKVIGWKMAVSAFVSEIVMDALGIATGGAGFLAKPLEVLLQAAVRIVLDTAERIYLSIVNPDLSIIGKFLDESLNNVLKLMGQVSAAITLSMALPLLVLFVLISTINPKNNAKVGAIGGDVGERVPGPGGTEVPNQPSVNNIGDCPVQNGYIWNNRYSYGYVSPGNYAQDSGGTAYDKKRHGTNAYWGSYCSCYNMPGGWVYSDAPSSHSENLGVCSRNGSCGNTGSNQNIYYGMAADFTSSTSDSVYVPKLGNEVGGEMTWNIVGTYGTTQGTAVKLTRNDGTNRFTMIMLHLNPASTIRDNLTLKEGDFVGELWGGNGENWKHVHIELVIDGTPVRPENYFCN